MILLTVLFILIIGCASKTSKLEGINYIDIVQTGSRISISYYSENPLKGKEEGRIQKIGVRCYRGTPHISLWVWKYEDIEGNWKTFLSVVKRWNVRRVYLQVSDRLSKEHVERLKSLGLEVYLLDGGRDTRINLNKSILESLEASGIQIDVEPYLNPDFNVRRELYIREYVNMLKSLRNDLGNVKLSVVIPFWFDKYTLAGRPLLDYVFEHADEVVVMAYRSSIEEALRLSREEIELSKRWGKKLYVGFELHRQKDEIHNIYKVEREGLRLVGRYKVRGDRLTLPMEKAKRLKLLSCKGVDGFVLHSFEVFVSFADK